MTCRSMMSMNTLRMESLCIIAWMPYDMPYGRSMDRMQDRDNIQYHLEDMEDIHIIDNYRELPIGDYQDILALCKDDSLEELDRQVKILSILTKVDEDRLLNLPITEFKVLTSKMGFLEKDLPTKVTRLAKSYKIGGFELVPVTDIRKVITAQYIDFQTFHQAGFDAHFVEILSCLLVPKGKKYNQDYDIIEVQDAIRRNLNVHDAASLYAFFLYSCRESMKDMLTFSLQEAKKIKDKEKRKKIVEQIMQQMMILQSNGDGLPT